MDNVRQLDAKPATARHQGATVVRTYGIGAQILKDLGLKRMRVLSAPKQLQGLAAFDLEVTEYVDGAIERRGNICVRRAIAYEERSVPMNSRR